MKADKTYRILIVGAGPSGLTLANTLASFGVKFDIIDVRKIPSAGSKGLTINVLSQYILLILGLQNKVAVSGEKINKLNIISQRNRVMTVNFNMLAGNKYLITQAQSQTESELSTCLVDSGYTISWGSRLKAIEVSGDVYTATLEKADASVEARQYDYIIGCDGKKSVVKDHMDVNFSGQKYPANFALADFYMQNHKRGEVDYIFYDESFFIIIPLSNVVCRVVLVCKEMISNDTNISDLLARKVNEYFGWQLIGSPALWTSSAEIYYKIADKIRQGNLFLCGDSCHLVSPIGGTGMNMGIQDAFSLGCKLGATILGFQSKQVLATYEEERLPIINQSCNNSDFLTRMILDADFREANINHFMPSIATRKQLKIQKPLLFSGLSNLQEFGCESTTNSEFGCSVGKICVELLQFLRGFSVDMNKRLKCLVILNSDFVELNQIAIDLLQNFAKYVTKYYSHVFRLGCVGKKEFLLDGYSELSMTIKWLPKNSFAIVNTQGVIEFCCSAFAVSDIKGFIDERYLMSTSVDVGREV